MRPALVLVLAAGCSTVRVARPLSPNDVASINDEVQSRTVAIELRGEGCCRYADEVVVAPDTTRWNEPPSTKRIRAPTEAIEAITIRQHARGLALGAGIGLSVGLAAGLVQGALYKGDEPNLVVGLTVISSVVVFSLLGAMIGAPHRIELTSPPP